MKQNEEIKIEEQDMKFDVYESNSIGDYLGNENNDDTMKYVAAAAAAVGAFALIERGVKAIASKVKSHKEAKKEAKLREEAEKNGNVVEVEAEVTDKTVEDE